MINISAINQTKAFARQDGALLALLWISAFALLFLLHSQVLVDY